MKTFLMAVFVTGAMFGNSLAQNPTPSTSSPQNNPTTQASQPTATPSAKNIRIAPGSVIPVQLTKTIDAKKAKTGDDVQAQVTEDLKAGNGEVIVPKNTKIMGKITESQPRNKEQKESQVGITFDRAVMKNEGDVPLPMSIQAVIAQSYLSPGNNNNNGGTEGAGQPSPSGTSGMSSTNGGRPSGMNTPQPPNPSAVEGEESGSTTKPHQPINEKTQGVLGIPDLKLSAAQPAQGSVLSSERNNVKLEGGTLLLLRVNQ